VGKIDLPIFSMYRVPELVGREGWEWFETALRRDLGTGGAFLSNFSYKRGERMVKE
jgi:hypothetical protein